MKVSAVGFLFQDKVKSKGTNSKNYTCVIHKVNPLGFYNKNVISSPKQEAIVNIVTPEVAQSDVTKSLLSISDKNSKSKFIGATIKDGIKETEIHSLISDKLFAVRTKDEAGKNHFGIKGKKATQNVLSHNLYLTA
jgi:hypothetical protein